MRVRRIEQEKKIEKEQKEKEKEREEQIRFSKESLEHQMDMDEQELENEDCIRKTLIKDVVDEANENGTPLSPAVLRLMNHFKGVY